MSINLKGYERDAIVGELVACFDHKMPISWQTVCDAIEHVSTDEEIVTTLKSLINTVGYEESSNAKDREVINVIVQRESKK